MSDALLKKSTEKNSVIKVKEEELKSQHEEMNFQSQVIQFLVMSLPDNRNVVKEKLYNFNNGSLKAGMFDNLQKIEPICQ